MMVLSPITQDTSLPVVASMAHAIMMPSVEPVALANQSACRAGRVDHQPEAAKALPCARQHAAAAEAVCVARTGATSEGVKAAILTWSLKQCVLLQ